MCRVRGCRRPVKARGLCNRHYLRWWKHGDPAETNRPTRGPCTISGCGRPRRARGPCGTHDERVRTRGHPDPDRPIRGSAPATPPEAHACHPPPPGATMTHPDDAAELARILAELEAPDPDPEVAHLLEAVAARRLDMRDQLVADPPPGRGPSPQYGPSAATPPPAASSSAPSFAWSKTQMASPPASSRPGGWPSPIARHAARSIARASPRRLAQRPRRPRSIHGARDGLQTSTTTDDTGTTGDDTLGAGGMKALEAERKARRDAEHRASQAVARVRELELANERRDCRRSEGTHLRAGQVPDRRRPGSPGVAADYGPGRVRCHP